MLDDASGPAFCDSTGLNVLLRSRIAARETGGSLELIGPHRPAARMFPQHPDVDAALASRSARSEEHG